MSQENGTTTACACRPPHLGSSCPDVTIIIGEYQWKVHSDVLVPKSMFFKKALEGQFQEASSKTITLHDDDPWLIVRMIQFINEDIFQLHYGDYNDEDPPQYFLTDFDKDMAHSSTWEEDFQTDMRASDLDIALGMFRIADKYMMDTLFDAIGCKLELIADGRHSQSILEKVLSKLSAHDLTRTQFFRDQFVRFVVSDPASIENSTLQQYCPQNPVLGLEIAKGYARG